MKKILFLLFLIPLFFIDNVNALTFEKCGEQVQVNDDNFIYYIYQNYADYFNTYDYYYFYNNYNNYGYRIFFSNYNNFYASGIGSSASSNYFNFNHALRLRFNTSFVYQGQDNYLSSGSTAAGYFNLDTFITNSNNFRVQISGGNSYIYDTITTKEDLENYFVCAVPNEYVTKNVVVINLLNDFIPLIPFVIVLSLIFTALGMFLNKKD